MRLITDNKTRRSKGIAYIEFKDTESVPLAMGLTDQKLLGVPIIVQASQAEKNRLSMPTSIITKGITTGPMRLYVGSLHFNITEDMLKGIFEPFGKVIVLTHIHDNKYFRVYIHSKELSAFRAGYRILQIPSSLNVKNTFQKDI